MDYLSKPDGNIVQLLTDTRIWATAIGATSMAFAEKQIYESNREAFGFAQEVNGKVFVVSPADYAKKNFVHDDTLSRNRLFLRLAIVVGAVSVIEFTKQGPKELIANLQYVMLGFASVALARVFQDLFPVLVTPARK
jgi:hypothetical protein